MAKSAGAWPWSSYPATVGRISPPSWLETDALLSQFSKQRQRTIEKYVDFVRARAGLPIVWHELESQIYLGDENFANTMQNTLKEPLNASGRDLERPKAQRHPIPKPIVYFAKTYDDQQEAKVTAYLSGDYTMKAIADKFGVHFSTVSRVITHFENSQKEDKCCNVRPIPFIVSLLLPPLIPNKYDPYTAKRRF